MKQIFDKLFFYIFTIVLILFIYLYLFQKELYYTYMNKIFNKSINKEINEEEKKYNKLFYSYIFFYIIFFLFTPLCKRKMYENAKIFYKKYEQKRLYDIFHNIIPYYKYSGIISEICGLLIIFSILIFFILNPHIELLYSFLILFSILFIIKCIIGLVTLLPDSSGNCTYSDLFGSCNDLLFSGHTAKILILLLLCDNYNLIPNYISNIYYILFAFMLIFILSARKHYTIDIIIGIIISLFIYMIYYNKNVINLF
jgi:hypothetical protein